jgi:hypothetical protein
LKEWRRRLDVGNRDHEAAGASWGLV